MPAGALRSAAAAFLAATVLAALAEAALQIGLGAVHVDPRSGPPSWAATLVGKGRWVAFALLAWALIRFRFPAAGSSGEPGTSPRPAASEIWTLTGVAVLAAPLVWLASGWAVTAAILTAAGRWDIDGRALLSLGYYRQVFTEYVPWLLAGLGVIGVSRHLRREPLGSREERFEFQVVPRPATVGRPDIMKTVSVKVFDKTGQLVGPLDLPRVEKTEAEWRALLTPEQFQVARAHGTERPFCGTLLDNKRHGVYTCICCGLPLFASNAKFDSGTGWPSFFQPVADENVAVKPDHSYGMVRVEILCARCDAHLGHVFPDGPQPTRQRHCVNSESLAFTDVADLASLADSAAEELTK